MALCLPTPQPPNQFVFSAWSRELSVLSVGGGDYSLLGESAGVATDLRGASFWAQVLPLPCGAARPRRTVGSLDAGRSAALAAAKQSKAHTLQRSRGQLCCCTVVRSPLASNGSRVQVLREGDFSLFDTRRYERSWPGLGPTCDVRGFLSFCSCRCASRRRRRRPRISRLARLFALWPP